MKILSISWICVLVASIVCVADASLTSLKTQLEHLEQDSTHLKTCLDKVTHPVVDVARFTGEIATVDHLIEEIEGRLQSTIVVMRAVMMIPIVGQVAASVLVPTINVLHIMENALHEVDGEISGVVSSIKGWTPGLSQVVALRPKLQTFVAAITKARKGVQWAVDGLDLFPHVHASGVFNQLDKVAQPLTSVVGGLNTGCSHVQSFLHKIHLVSRKRSLPSLHKVISILKSVNNAFGPLGNPLDDLNDLMSKKICIVNGILKIGKEIIMHVEKEVLHGIESAAKATGHAIKQVGHEVQHVANQVAQGTQHAVHQVAHETQHVVHQAVKETQHIVHSVGHAVHSIAHHLGFGRREEAAIIAELDRQGRGLDLCFSINDALNIADHGLGFIKEQAEAAIKKLMSGLLSKINIPALGSEVLGLGNVLKVFNLRFPDVTSMTSLADTAVRNLQNMNPIQAFVKSAAGCASNLF